MVLAKHWDAGLTEVHVTAQDTRLSSGCKVRLEQRKHAGRGGSEERRKSGRLGGEGIPFRFGAFQYTGHKNRLAPYTSSLHVKGRLHCPGLTAHLTCLEWKKGEISPPVSPLKPTLVLTNQLAVHFSRKDDLFTLGLNSEWTTSSRMFNF